MTDSHGLDAFVTPAWARRFCPRESMLAAKAQPETTIEFRLGSASLPQMKYRNDSGRPRCVIKCLASALHYIGYAEEAANMVVNYDQITHTHHRRGEIAHLRETIAVSMKKRRVTMRKGMHDLSSLVSPITPGKHHNPIVAMLKAACFEGGKKRSVPVNHTVCFLGEFVFDSNWMTVSRLTRKTLTASAVILLRGHSTTVSTGRVNCSSIVSMVVLVGDAAKYEFVSVRI